VHQPNFERITQGFVDERKMWPEEQGFHDAGHLKGSRKVYFDVQPSLFWASKVLCRFNVTLKFTIT
jgi:hypothetical protein